MTQVGFAYQGPIFRTTSPDIKEALGDGKVRYHKNYNLSYTGRVAVPLTPARDEPFVPTVFWERTPSGYNMWMSPGMHEAFSLIMGRVRAGRTLSASGIARDTGLSQGYVTKVIRKLAQFGFIEIKQVIRGRLGGTIATLVKSFLHKRTAWRNDLLWRLRSPERGTIERRDNPWGSFDRAMERALQL